MTAVAKTKIQCGDCSTTSIVLVETTSPQPSYCPICGESLVVEVTPEQESDGDQS